jgi:hypothetical protein
MKLGLNACSFIVLMLIAGLAIAVPADRAKATMCYWDTDSKQMICVDLTELTSGPTATSEASSSAPVSCMWSWDTNTKQMICVDLNQLTSTPTTAQTSTTKTTAQTSQASEPCWSEYLQLMLGYCPPTGAGPSLNTGVYYGSTSSYTPSSGSPGPGYYYYSKICTSLCGCQYNVWVNFDYNCENDIPA